MNLNSENLPLLHLFHDLVLEALPRLVPLRGLVVNILFFLFYQDVLVVKTDVNGLVAIWERFNGEAWGGFDHQRVLFEVVFVEILDL